MIVFNAEHKPVHFILPEHGQCKRWMLLMETTDGAFLDVPVWYDVKSEFEIAEHSLSLFKLDEFSCPV